MSHEEYNNIVALNYSGCKALLRSPGHYKAWLTEDKKDSPAMQLGRVVHIAALQPEVLFDRVAVLPQMDRRTKEGKAAYEAAMASVKEGQEVVSQDLFDDAMKITTAAREAIKTLNYDICEAEQTFVKEWGVVKIKGRVDLLAWDSNNETFVIDLKTTQDASPAAFARDVVNFKYHLQAAWYMRLTGAKKFVIVAQEKEAPYANRIYTLDEAAIAEGNRLMDEGIALYTQCVTFDSWPSYPKDQSVLSLPKWAFSNNQ